MSKYYKAEDIIRKRAEDLADTSYWEYGNPKNVDEWIEVAEMEFADIPTIELGEGEWLEKGVYANDDGEMEMVEEWQGARCSICERYFVTPYLYYFDVHKYCPHCGSKMKG